MQIVIHCGLDKAGSTAIQAHVALFRQWLLRNRIYLPATGLSGFGHVALFRDLGADNWQPLLDELGQLDPDQFSRCFFSYEGICKFDEEELALIRRHLRDYEVSVLFYLREQAEILQSGYLQQLKSRRQGLSIAHLNSDHSLLVPASRDYDLLLRKFESVFGKKRIALRLYEPGKWRDGSIVWDLLEFLGCPPDSEFTAATQRQNISLDLQSARILNLFDSYDEDAAARTALVEDLLWLVQKYPGGSRYFLDAAAVGYIRHFYQDSNAALAGRYGVEFDYRDCSAGRPDEPAGGGIGSVSYVDKLANLARYPRWKGGQLDGAELADLLLHSAGWSRFESWGVWSVGDASQLTFRVPVSRFIGLEESLTLHFRGRYFSDNRSTQIWINGHFLDDADLREGAVTIPLALLDQDRVAHLELRHHGAISPAALAINADARRLAYGLQGLNYRLSA